MNSALEDLKTLVRDAEEVLTHNGAAADAQVSEMHERLRQVMEQSRARLRTLHSAATERLHTCDAYVRAHPYESIGAALAAGALIGLFLVRRPS